MPFHTPTITFDSVNFTSQSAIEKRALSYAVTIHHLFEQIMANQQAADNTLAAYFREHKKHGSKDRRVIRESLFAIFRWWGWLKQIPVCSNNDKWLAILTSVGVIENHQWQDIIQAWQHLGKITLTDNFDNKLALIERAKKICEQHQTTTLSLFDLAPDWFWEQILTNEPQLVAQSLCERPPVWARLQNITTEDAIAALKTAGLTPSLSDYFPYAVNLGTTQFSLQNIPLFQQGNIEIQDLASQVIANICAPKANEIWWDACSGAGGKSLQLSSIMQNNADLSASNNGYIIASDIRHKALEELKKRYQRANITNINIRPWKSSSIPVEKNAFDGVLVDAPCSCTGTWRRNPDMRWIESFDSINQKPELQLSILHRAATAVKQGGYLIYATCSLLNIENQQVVNSFINTHPEFELTFMTHPFTQKQTKMLTIWPHEANTDGMFVVKMKKIQ